MTKPALTRLDFSQELYGHFTRLSVYDRRLRFGSNISDFALSAYVMSLDPEDDMILTQRDDEHKIIAVAHLARLPTRPLTIEVGITVEEEHRRKGIATNLMSIAIDLARGMKMERLIVHCLAENHSIRALVKKLGMTVSFEGTEGDAYLLLTPETT